MFYLSSAVVSTLTFSKNSFRNTRRVTKNIGPRSGRRYLGPGLALNCLKMLFQRIALAVDLYVVCDFLTFLYMYHHETNSQSSLNYLKHYLTPDSRQSKTLLTIEERRLKSLETEFLIAICRTTGDKWQSKTPVLTIFDLRLS